MRLLNHTPFGVAILAASLSSSPLAAQVEPSALPSREQIELPRADPQQPRAGVTVTDATRREADCPFDGSIQIEINRLRFTLADGSPPPAELASLLAGLKPEAGKQPLAQLCELRDAAAGALSRAGYIAGVIIPPQEIETGEATLIVIPARLVDVKIQGSAGPHQRLLESRIRRLTGLPVLNTREIERILLGTNDVPGLQVALALRAAGTGPGQVTGELSVSYTPFLLLANVQNSGSRTLGRESGSLRAEYYGLTGHADRSFIGLSSTLDFSEQQIVQLGHYFGTDNGLTFGGRFSHAWSRPDLGALDIRSRSLIGGIDISAPLRRSVTSNADLGGGFEIIEQNTKLRALGGGIPVTQDKLRVGYLRASFSAHKPRFGAPDAWGLGASIELRQGFDIFDATETGTITPAGYAPSRFDGDASATVVRAGANGVVALGKAFSLSGTVQGQWASGPLLSFEEFSVGNLTIGRGYDPGVTAGDKALGGRIEPRVELPLKSRIGAQLFGFYDVVRIWNEDLFTTENGRSLHSFGGGVRAYLPGIGSLEAVYAHPRDRELNLPGARRASDRLLLSLTLQFAPRR